MMYCTACGAIFRDNGNYAATGCCTFKPPYPWARRLDVRKVYKFPLDLKAGSAVVQNDSRKFVLGQPLRVAQQGEQWVAWIEVWYDAEGGETPADSYRFHCVPTGGFVPPGAQFVCTEFEGPYVWHWYYTGGSVRG